MRCATTGCPKLPQHLTHVPRIRGLPGLDQQGEGLAGDTQVDPGVMGPIADRARRLPAIKLGLHFRQIPQGVEELIDQCAFSSGRSISSALWRVSTN